MTKTELINEVAQSFSSTSKKNIEVIIKNTFYVIGKELARGGKVQIAEFGTFENRVRSERKGRNPRTGEEIIIAERLLPSFKAAKRLKAAVNERRELP